MGECMQVEEVGRSEYNVPGIAWEMQRQNRKEISMGNAEPVKYGPTGQGIAKVNENGFPDMEPSSVEEIKQAVKSEADEAYKTLSGILDNALLQASSGKGKERHANDNRFEDQVICTVGRLLKDHPFGAHAYQVIKKTIEAGRLYKIKGKDAAYNEMLGAINYAAAMNILISEE